MSTVAAHAAAVSVTPTSTKRPDINKEDMKRMADVSHTWPDDADRSTCEIMILMTKSALCVYTQSLSPHAITGANTEELNRWKNTKCLPV